jgi:hypothetical protein
MKPIRWMTLLALAHLCPLLGSDDQDARQTLVGITTVAVFIQDLPEAAAKLGLTKDAIQTDVELKLRLAGMRIDPTTREYLDVEVNVVDSGRAASIDVELYQPVTLVREPSILLAGAPTWSTGSLRMNSSAQGIRDSIKDKADAFLNAWLSVNPKK